MPAAKADIQDIDALKTRHRELDRQKTTAEANHKTAQDQLAKLKEDARAKYATDDVDQLKQKLLELKQENERKRAEYQKHLDAIETRLGEIEVEYAKEA
jgi:hypothetical protein